MTSIFCKKKLVQNVHICLKKEFKHFNTPYMEFPPPAVFHDKAKRTQQGDLLMTEVTSMGWSTSASEALLPLPEFFWWKSCASCPDWGEGEGEGCGGNTGTAEKKIFRTCSFNPYICSLCSPPSSSSPTPQSTTSSSPDCLAHPSSLWHFSLHWK